MTTKFYKTGSEVKQAMYDVLHNGGSIVKLEPAEGGFNLTFSMGR